MNALACRHFPIILLQRLNLIDEAIPLSNFCFKVRLAQGIFKKLLTGSTISKLFQFHSFFDGEVTVQLQHNGGRNAPSTPTLSIASSTTYTFEKGVYDY